MRDLAEHAALNAVAGFDQVGGRASLSADLNDPAVLAGRRDHGLSFDNVDRDRLLHVYVGAGLHGLDRRQAMPVVRRGDLDDVGLLLLEQFAIVAVGPRRLAGLVPFGSGLGVGGQALAVGIAERDDLDVFNLHQAEEVVLAVPARADERDPPGPVGRPSPHECQAGRCGADERASIKELLCHVGVRHTEHYHKSRRRRAGRRGANGPDTLLAPFLRSPPSAMMTPRCRSSRTYQVEQSMLA